MLRKDLLQKIAVFLDVDSLFELGRTCHELSNIVFTTYVSNRQPQRGYYGINEGIRYLSAPTFHPDGLLTAFRCCLTLRRSLKSIAYGFLPPHGFEGLVQDLSDLYTIFVCQPRGMEHICVYLSLFDQASK